MRGVSIGFDGCGDRNPHRNPSALVYKAVDGRQGFDVSMKSGTNPSPCIRTHAHVTRAHALARTPVGYGRHRNPSKPPGRPRLCRLAQKGCGAEREHRNPSRVPARTRVSSTREGHEGLCEREGVTEVVTPWGLRL